MKVPVQGHHLRRAAPKVKGQPMATDDSTTQGRDSQAFSGDLIHKRLDNFKLSKTSLQTLECTLWGVINAVQKAQNKRNDNVQCLCDSVGITKRELAGGVILRKGGNTLTVTALCRLLRIGRRTLYNWPEIVRALNTEKEYRKFEFQNNHRFTKYDINR